MSEFQLSSQQADAIDFVVNTVEACESRVIFITGKAGTGKSTILRELRSRLKCVVAAPTGLAALNIRATTIHRLFGFKIGPQTRTSIKKHDKALFAGIDVIIIDEVSMVRADMMDAIDIKLRKTTGVDRPFGGLTVVLFGDMWQLEPVCKEEEWGKIKAKYSSPFWMDALEIGRAHV